MKFFTHFISFVVFSEMFKDEKTISTGFLIAMLASYIDQAMELSVSLDNTFAKIRAYKNFGKNGKMTHT